MEGNNVTVHDVWLAADVGQVVNLSGLENQLQGSVVDGVSAMAAQSITVKNGAVVESNYDSYPLLRMPQSPRVHVQTLVQAIVLVVLASLPCHPWRLPFATPSLTPAASVFDRFPSVTGVHHRLMWCRVR